MNRLLSRFTLFVFGQLSRLSWKQLYHISDFLSWLVFDMLRYRRKVIWNNLRNSFPEKEDEDLAVIAAQFYRHFTDLILETIKLQSATAEEIMERIPNPDAQIADDLFTRKKNVVFVLGHRGNWELANLYASLRFKQEVIVAYKPLSNANFDKWFRRLRTRFGSSMVPMNQIHSYLAKPRQNPYMVVLVNDQSPNPFKAYWTHFLNQETGVFRGAETISRQHDTALYYFDIVKDPYKRGFYKIQMTEITETPNTQPANSLLEQQIRILERDIRAQPHNWLWSHKRWKHRRPDVLATEQLLQS